MFSVSVFQTVRRAEYFFKTVSRAETTMGRLFAFAISVITFLVIAIDAHLTTADIRQLENTDLPSLKAPLSQSLEVESSESSPNRSLRTVDKTDIVAEERGVQSAVYSALSKMTKPLNTKLSNRLQIKAWLKRNFDPKAVYDELGFTGQELAKVIADPRYEPLYLAFGTAWRAN
ncbi:unnamed protein product [Phytophthora fragariaefolia]|uniref:RxLR effector protein n=1 Tax=Phytophthora fragariaefolia TaxID=1490495 RepID=A0A9W7D656_9STRA|nr:unnamed protein product [Phytophthora fragariaefolia]